MKKNLKVKCPCAVKTLTFGLAICVPPEISLLTGFSFIYFKYIPAFGIKAQLLTRTFFSHLVICLHKNASKFYTL